MAFNMFNSFRKYQKFWMSTVLLLCMVTFVLCTGVGGDLSDRLMKAFAPRHGSVIAKVDGHDLYGSDLEQLKGQRNIANEFMNRSVKYTMQFLDEKFKEFSESKDEKTRQEKLGLIMRLKMEFQERQKRSRYFESGTKLDDLADFKVWLAVANRLGVKLDDAALVELVRRDLYDDYLQLVEQYTPALMRDLRREYNIPGDQYVMNALRDEYRARIAQLASVQTMPKKFMGPQMYPGEEKFKVIRTAISPEQLWEYYKENRSEFVVSLVPILPEMFSKDLPAPTKEELEAFFHQHRKQPYDPRSDKPGFSTPQQIKVEYVTADPDSETYKHLSKVAAQLELVPPIGFQLGLSPMLMSIRYAIAPLAEQVAYQQYYDNLPAGRRFQFSTGAPTATVDQLRFEMFDYLAQDAPLAAAGLIASQASLDGGLTAAPIYYAQLQYLFGKKVEPLIKEEAKKRVPLYAAVAASVLGDVQPFQTLTAVGMWKQISGKRGVLPLALVQSKFKEEKLKAFASEIVSSNMIALRKALEAKGVAGKAKAIDNELSYFAPKMSFERKTTKDFYSRYNIQEAPELKGLRDAFQKYRVEVNFIDGRAGSDRELKEGDFYRLFFDSSEPYSAAGAAYNPRPWPPNIQVKKANPNQRLDPADMGLISKDTMQRVAIAAQIPNAPAELLKFNYFDQARQPYLFWKAKEEPPSEPKSIEPVKALVEEAYKLDKARVKMQDEAKKVAELLQQPGIDPTLVSIEESKRLGKERIVLRNLAPLSVPFLDEIGNVQYRPYKLPRDIISFPREDTEATLLSLSDPKAAVKVDNGGPIDRLNETLFKSYQDSKKATSQIDGDLLKARADLETATRSGAIEKIKDATDRIMAGEKKKQAQERRLVQVLANKPRTAYYVAVITVDPFADRMDFEESYKGLRGNPHGQNAIIQLSYDNFAREYRAALMKQLRVEYGVWVTENAEERKSYDNDATN